MTHALTISDCLAGGSEGRGEEKKRREKKKIKSSFARENWSKMKVYLDLVVAADGTACIACIFACVRMMGSVCDVCNLSCP
ncbi:hypothetical protein DM02DRAFT_380781 [Periconia macrospinosa]|uniref:Uncharacterized protein n=1 Tax=Periconia macrospinosa TaxID=97972 RepID=A0A2V1E9D4_9PLEO|nr:hypothetical protein DM02DRAFT_380781 [Periconia macrospinosa]